MIGEDHLHTKKGEKKEWFQDRTLHNKFIFVGL